MTAKRTWHKQFDNAAVLRKGFEEHVCPNLKAPNCRVHVIYADGIDTLSKLKFDDNLYRKAQIVGHLVCLILRCVLFFMGFIVVLKLFFVSLGVIYIPQNSALLR